MRVYVDFETRSFIDITKQGLEVYAKHPSTEVLCIAYTVGDTSYLVSKDDDLGLAHLLVYVADPECVFVAHNAGFEQAIWRYVMQPKYGVPPIAIHRWRCTAAKGTAYGIPRSLEEMAEALGLPHQKDLEGAKVMKRMCAPRKPTKKDPSIWRENPEDFEALHKYCIQDTAVSKAIDETLDDLSFDEQRYWFMDQEINQRGIEVDKALAVRVIDLYETRKAQLLGQFVQLTKGLVQSPAQTAAFLTWCRARGYMFSDLQKATVAAFLELNTGTPEVREALKIRQQVSKTSIGKFTALMERTTGSRLFDAFVFNAASTRRWGGEGVQLQNLPRGKGDSYAIIDDIKTLSAEAFFTKYPETMATFSSAIRGLFISAPGKELHVVDYSSVEAVVNAWFCGEAGTLAAFHNKDDVYCLAAQKIYGRPVNKTDHQEERQVGKVSTLFLGYNGGIAAFGNAARGYGLDMNSVYLLIWPTADEYEQRSAKSACAQYLKSATGDFVLSEEAALAADVIKQRWRAANPNIVATWAALEEAAIHAVRFPGCKSTPSVPWAMGYYSFDKGVLCFHLPSGGVIRYYNPSIHIGTTPWGTDTEILNYWGIRMLEGTSRKIYCMVSTYGGKLLENIIQALSRDLLAHGMLVATERGFDIVMHVHDEAIAEQTIGDPDKTLDKFKQALTTLPPWAQDVPLGCDGWTATRYRK
jgi:DNA polymerase